jgi:hypothetical protein
LLPGAHFVRAEALLLRDELQEGWEEYGWQCRAPDATDRQAATAAVAEAIRHLQMIFP